MRIFSVVLAIFLAVLFVGGFFSIGGKPVLERMDSVFGTTSLMGLHYGVFFFV
jgi:hypothetical protein